MYKFNNTKEGWHEFALKFRVISDSRGYDGIIEGTETPPDEKENLEILDEDDAEVKEAKKEKQVWLAFLGRKRTELVNTGHIMDDETFITHLFNSLPQAEYEGGILAIKERLRRNSYDLAEIEQILEDKYQSMKYVKGWEEEKDDYALFASPDNKKGNKKRFKGRCGYCGEFGHKAVNVENSSSLFF